MRAHAVFAVVATLATLTTLATLATLAACSKAEMKELEESDAMEAKAQSYCADTMGLALDPKSLVACKEHYIQGMKDGKKSQ